MTAERVNTAFALEAHLLGTVDGDVRTTRFVLRHSPDVAAWLLSIPAMAPLETAT